jgi:hypothetical protein
MAQTTCLASFGPVFLVTRTSGARAPDVVVLASAAAAAVGGGGRVWTRLWWSSVVLTVFR